MVAITVAIAATVFVYVNQMATSTETGKNMNALYSSKNSTAFTVTYKVTSADAGILWSGVTASWNGGSDLGMGANTTGTTYVAVGNYFTVNVTAIGTYDIDLLYDSHIIWTAPSVVV